MLNYLSKYLNVLIGLEFMITIFIIFENTGILMIPKRKDEQAKKDFTNIYFFLRTLTFGLIVVISFLYLFSYKKNKKQPVNKTPTIIEKQSNEAVNTGRTPEEVYQDITDFSGNEIIRFQLSEEDEAIIDRFNNHSL